ncbi:hypothetical protein A2627_01075 [Candidatus Woesebacteria bacterium RIFCSPHIGHO2_01_FULL_39_28]|uniref:Uncharacterized protein n=1 Tax=Candidatus Woesebacteria bacterium RIFCSPHIGHO2_01_FULL_39_28 TaxID=1802496 RepID=A0A1F7YGZ7_9BACT|nr:MAG: hypothetical protein A2627_01075 [Candidatus Woesebacteria bacterium RIFCSPHIGHO2_01_FULL_39_28]
MAKTKWLTRRRIVIILILAVLIFGWKTYRSQRPKFSVETAKVTRSSITESLSASGKIDATEKANLTFQTTGKISWIGAKEGNQITKGQAIAKLDTIKLNSDYQRALSDLRSTQATVDRIHDDLKNHDSDETFLQKETRTEAESANDKAYEAFIKAQKDLKDSTLVSPLTGIIAKIDPDQIGVNVSAFSSSYLIINPESFVFEAEVNEVDIAKLTIGQKVLITLDAFPDEELEGITLSISYSSILTSTGATAYKVKVKLPGNKNQLLRLGMNGDAEFIFKTVNDVLTVPSTSVVETGDKKFVWIVNTSEKAHKKEITTGVSSIDLIEVKSNLTDTETVITRPPTDIKDGDKIKIL